MDFVRLFFAIWLPEPVLDQIQSLQERLRAAAGIRWAGRTNLHCTLRFLGEQPPKALKRLEQAAQEAAAQIRPFQFEAASVGVFPVRGEPRVVWVGVRSGAEALVALATELDHRLRTAGFGPPDKPFRPHLTIGRASRNSAGSWSGRGPASGAAPSLASLLAQEAEFSAGWVPVSSFALVSSQLNPAGAVYTTIRTFPLGAP